MQLNAVTFVLCTKDKLVEHFLKMPRDFHHNEAVKLLGYFGFTEVKKGKSSGSRVKFQNEQWGYR